MLIAKNLRSCSSVNEPADAIAPAGFSFKLFAIAYGTVLL